MGLADALLFGVAVLYFSTLAIWGTVEAYQLSERVRFSVRRMMILVTIAAIVLGLLSAAARW